MATHKTTWGRSGEGEVTEDDARLGLGLVALTGDGQQASGDLLFRPVARPNATHPPASQTFDSKSRARFWRKVSPAPADACWIWHGARGSSGYGNVGKMVDGRAYTYLAHRVAYEITFGAVPAGLDIDHTCRNKRCVNPSHLEPVTFLANMRRRYSEKPDERLTHCIRGHLLNAENVLYVWTTGQIRCRKCDHSRRAS